MNNNNSRKWFCQLNGLDSMECGLKPTEFFSHHFPLNFSVENNRIWGLEIKKWKKHLSLPDVHIMVFFLTTFDCETSW